MDRSSQRVAIFMPSLRGGGAERSMLTLAQGLVPCGFAVDLVLTNLAGAQTPEDLRGVNLVDLGARRVGASIPPLIRYLRTSRPAALISALNHANVAALIAKTLSRVPVRTIVSVRNVLSLNIRRSPNLRDRLLLFLAGRLYPDADAIVTVSRAVREDLFQLMDLQPEKVRVIYNPIDIDSVARQAAERVRHPWFERKDHPVILGVGRLTPQKDFPTLIRAFHVLQRQRRSRLLILGEGELRAKLERMIAGLNLLADVQLCGYVPNPYPYFANADIFVLSSAWEGFARVVLEAMACGTPVVSTDCPGGPSEILMDGKYGLMTPVGQPEALARAVLSTLQDPPPSGRLRARAAEFSVERIASQFAELILE